MADPAEQNIQLKQYKYGLFTGFILGIAVAAPIIYLAAPYVRLA